MTSSSFARRRGIRALRPRASARAGRTTDDAGSSEATFARDFRGEGHSTIKPRGETKDFLEARSVTMGICPRRPRNTSLGGGEQERRERLKPAKEKQAEEEGKEESQISASYLYHS